MKKIIFFVIVALLYSGTCMAGKRFTLVTVNFPPYYAEEMLNGGWISEIVKAALEDRGYEVEIRFMEWKKALDDTQNGYYDALLGAYFTRERAEHYYFSAPIAQTRTGFFRRKDVKIRFKELEELKHFKIGVVEGYATSKDFDAADYFEKVKVSNLDEGLKMLYNEEIDLMADSRAVGKYRLKILENEISGISKKIKFIRPVLAMNKLYVAVSKKATNAHRKLIDFNLGFREILKNRTYRKIKKNHRGYPRKK
jgi:polar amino acid transport system substrate-binding protein